MFFLRLVLETLSETEVGRICEENSNGVNHKLRYIPEADTFYQKNMQFVGYPF